MKTILMTALLGTAAVLSTTSAAAQTTTLTFDSLDGTNSVYGSGANGSLPANVTGDGQYIAYTQNGYEVRLNTANDPNTTYGAHIGDGYNGGSATFNWHDDGDNGQPTSITVSRVGGGLFNLSSFDYFTTGTLVATGGLSTLTLMGTGTSNGTGFSKVNSVTFSSTGYTYNGLDNLVLSATSAVPEPATWALMILGFGAVGGAMRRRQSVAAKIRFA